MVLTIIKNKRGRFDGLDTKDKKAVADALSLQADSVAVWVFDDDSMATMSKMHQTQATKEVDVTLQTLRSTRAAKVAQLMANRAEGPHWPKARRRRPLENFGL